MIVFPPQFPSLLKPICIFFEGKTNGGVSDIPWTSDGTYGIKGFGVSIYDWGKALAGEYTATITYTAEVVVEQ